MPQLSWLFAAHLVLAAEAPLALVTVESTAQLTASLADPTTDIVWLKLALAQLDRGAVSRLRTWVERGGTLWIGNDVAELFGFELAAVSEREQAAHGRRAAALGATSLLGQVEDVYGRPGPGGAFLVSHPTALPLLRVADPVADYPSSRFLAAQLDYGQGRVLFRPAELHPSRGESERFAANLLAWCRRFSDDALIPLETLEIAHQRLAGVPDLLSRKPDEARAILNQVFLAYRLWYADYLTASGKTDEATALLAAIARELPDDPAVYLAVARLNEALGRTAPAEEARAKAAEAYARLKRRAPGPDARQLRVTWPIFAESINAMGRAWERPTAASVAEAVARSSYLLGLDRYRRYDLAGAAELWAAAAKGLPSWPLPAFYLGLLAETQALELARPASQQTALHRQAESWFGVACSLAPTADFTAGSVESARAWQEAARSRAAAKALEPPDLLRRGLVIIRYHASDRRWQVGPLKESIARAYDEASAYTTRWGVWADGLEVLVHDNYEAMAAALPRQGVTPQAFAAAATVGRRIHTVPQTDELFRIARHQVAHAVVNALTEDGLPPPLWLSEGLAWSAQETTTVSKMAEINIRRGRMLTVPQINDPVVFYDRRNADQANGQAELMTEAFIQRYGLAPIVPLLQNIGWGITPDQAFARATSLTQEQFLTAWVQGRLGR